MYITPLLKTWDRIQKMTEICFVPMGEHIKGVTITNLLRICFLISLAGSNQFCKENVSFFQFELENTINIIFKAAMSQS